MRQRPSRPIPSEFYSEVAAVYLEATAGGNYQPGKLIADTYATPPGTVNHWIATCRRMGLIPPTTPGKASGVAWKCRTCGRPL